MKKAIYILLISVLWSFSYAQGEKDLAIRGLHNPKKMATLNVISIELINANSSSQAYRILRQMDIHSQKISEAVQTSRAYQQAFIKFDGVDGEIRKELKTIYLSDYSMTSGGSGASTETFHIHFDTQNNANN